MKVTAELKQWLVSNDRAAADADEATIKQAAMAAVLDGTLSAAELTRLTAGEKASGIQGMLQEVIDGQKAMNDRLAAVESGAAIPTPAGAAAGGKAAGTDFNKMFAGAGNDGAGLDGKDLSPEGAVRVKSIAELYDANREKLRYPEVSKNGRGRHPFAGQHVVEDGHMLERGSDLDKAVMGAYFKMMLLANCQGAKRYVRLTEHDNRLIEYALHEEKWNGVIHGGAEGGDEAPGAIGIKNRKLSPSEQKAILDDATSGGLEIAPIVFDDEIIRTPLLHGELFPLVYLKTITRGRRIEGGTIGNVTLSSGGADASAISLFNTASFIAAFDVNIHVVNGAVEIGLDFLSDSPIAVAEEVTRQYGEVLLSWLDEQIASGDGSTEPEGIFEASGTGSVTMGSDAPTVGDYENLLFGVPKQYKKNTEPGRIVYVANETTYARARAIAVGASDQRRVFGMDHENYMLLNHPYKIEDGLANTRVGFFNAKRYRMYRRAGLVVRGTTEGKELVRNNLMLLAARARFGGALEDGNAAAIATDAQA